MEEEFLMDQEEDQMIYDASGKHSSEKQALSCLAQATDKQVAA